MGRYSGMKRPRPATGLLRPEIFSEEDWEEYFACRARYDRPVSEDELRRYVSLYRSLTAQGRQKEALTITSKNVPLQPHIAIHAKNRLGLKAIRNFNLYEAKKTYPDEF